MRFVALTPELLRILPLRDPRAAARMSPDYVAAATQRGMGWAALEGGYILGAGGLVSIWHGRAVAWMLPSIFARPRHFARAVRFARFWLDGMQRAPEFRRIECHVLNGFTAGVRVVARLGFVLETPPLEAWDQDGNDHLQFKRVAPAPSTEGCQLAAASRVPEIARVLEAAS
jgi:hypothetical protein